MNTARRRLLAAAPTLILCHAAASWAQNSPADAEEARLRVSLETAVPSLLEKGEVTGFSIAVIRDGAILWTGAYGVQDSDERVAVDRRTVFQAASLSKPVFAYAVLRLVERGVIDLDTPLATYLPYERLEHDARYKQITARMVLSHSTGLPNWGGDRLELNFDPGTDFNYSGEGFVYLQKAVEKLTGKDIDTIVREEVFRPFGMTNSSYTWRKDFEGRAAVGHDDQGRAMDVVKHEEGNSAFSLLTTAEDYARFLIAVMEGTGLRAETVTDAFDRQVRMTDRPEIEAKDRLYWGLGWGLQYGVAGRALWHWGHNDGFRDYVIVYPDQRSGVVYFANSENGLSIVENLLALVVDDDQWALAWLDYEQYDDPVRIARRDLEATFLHEGEAVGLQRYAELRDAQPEVVGERFTNQLGYFLLGERENAAAIEVFKLNVEHYPESSNVWDSLGEAYMNVGEYAPALEYYRRSVELDPENENGEQKIVWLSEAEEVLENPVTVPLATLRSYVGDYGPRHIMLAEDQLIYQREGSPEYRLIPMSQDTFMLDRQGSFRIRFVSDETGRVTKIVGMYVNGFEDETPRDL